MIFLKHHSNVTISFGLSFKNFNLNEVTEVEVCKLL